MCWSLDEGVDDLCFVFPHYLNNHQEVFFLLLLVVYSYYKRDGTLCGSSQSDTKVFSRCHYHHLI